MQPLGRYRREQRITEDSLKRDLSFSRHYTSKAVLLGIFVSLGAILLGYKPFGKSFMLGALCSCFNTVLMNLFYSNLLFRNRKSASFKAFLFVLIRFAVLAVPLILALTNKNFNFIGAILGIFAVQMIIFWENVILAKLKIRF